MHIQSDNRKPSVTATAIWSGEPLVNGYGQVEGVLSPSGSAFLFAAMYVFSARLFSAWYYIQREADEETDQGSHLQPSISQSDWAVHLLWSPLKSMELPLACPPCQCIHVIATIHLRSPTGFPFQEMKRKQNCIDCFYMICQRSMDFCVLGCSIMPKVTITIIWYDYSLTLESPCF